MRAARNPEPTRRGFTLVEIVVVVLVLGILAGVAAPKYRAAIEGVELEAAARRLAADLRRARDTAIREGQTCGIEFFPLAEAYRSHTAGERTLADSDHPGQAMRVVLGANSGVGLVATDFTDDSVLFDFRGDPSAAGTVDLQSTDATRSVSVGAAGEVTITP